MAALQAGIGSEPDERRRAATLDAIELGLRKVRAEQSGEPLDEKVALAYARADETVFSKVRAGLGFDRCEMYYSGAAPAPVELFEFFAAIGIQICEVWGMSELSCVATLVPRDALRFGTVGKPLPGVELRLARRRRGARARGDRDGRLPQPAREDRRDDRRRRLAAHGRRRLARRGRLPAIIDRKKELIINAAGKNMSPANIEQQLKSASPLIGQAIVIGDRRPYNVALIVLDPDACAAFAARHGLADGVGRGDVN